MARRLADIMRLRNMAKKGLLTPQERKLVRNMLKSVEALRERLRPYINKVAGNMKFPHRTSWRYGALRVALHIDRTDLANTKELTLDIRTHKDRLLDIYLSEFFRKLRHALEKRKRRIRNKAIEIASGNVLRHWLGPNYRYYYERYDAAKAEAEAILIEEHEWVMAEAKSIRNRWFMSRGRAKDVLRLIDELNKDKPDAQRVYALLHRLYFHGPKKGRLRKIIKWAYVELSRLLLEPDPLVMTLAERAKRLGFSVMVQGPQIIIRPEPRLIATAKGTRFPWNYILSIHLMLLGSGLTAIKIYIKELWRIRLRSPKELVKVLTSRYNRRYKGKTLSVEFVDPRREVSSQVEEPWYLEGSVWVRFEGFASRAELEEDPKLIALKYALIRLIAALLLNERLLIDERSLSWLPVGALLKALGLRDVPTILNMMYLAAKIWYTNHSLDRKPPPVLIDTSIVLVLG